MIDLILNNKEWLFSGIGITITTLCLSLIKRYRQKAIEPSPSPVGQDKFRPTIDPPEIGSQTDSARALHESSPEQRVTGPSRSDEGKFLLRPYPKEIVSQIESAPVIHKSSRAKEFKSLRVRWKTTLHGADDREGKISLMLLDRGHYPWITCEVPKDKYPDLSLAKDGTVIWVSGVIADYQGNVVKLEEAELSIIL